MAHRFILASLAALVAGVAQAQPPVIPPAAYPPIPGHAALPAGFVPKGWRLERKAEGDLNGDGKPDLVLVLKDADPRNIVHNDSFGPDPFDTNPRILVIALAGAAGGYDLAEANHVLIPRSTEPNVDDYLEDAAGPEIKGGVLRVGLHLFANAGGSDMGEYTFSFRDQSGRFTLIGYDHSIVGRMSGETEDVSVNFLSSKEKTSKGRIDSDRKSVTWKSLPRRPLRDLDQVGDGMEFDPDAAP
jgi:hypothetical protein